MGPFFCRLADYLAAHGANASKVNFNGGDEHFYRRPGAHRYAGDLAGWPAWLRRLIEAERSDGMVLFGQSRPVHRCAIDMAEELSIPVFVFEEGYIRPNYVTLELGGVNGRSSLPRDPKYYREGPYPRLTRPKDTNQTFARMAWYATRYATATFVLQWRYPNNLHHRDLSGAEAMRWVRGGCRKVWFALRERNLLDHLASPEQSKRWFLLALQVHNDSQLIEHSPYSDVPEVIHEVMDSFAVHSPPATSLVIKHHPMERAHRDYSGLINDLARKLDLRERVLYVHDLHLPTLLKHARGVVTVNSTTGLQAMYHGTPVCVMGDSLYALPGLVHFGGLKTFWHSPGEVDLALFRRFRAQVVKLTQINASFYAEAPALVQPQVDVEPASQGVVIRQQKARGA
ncbi:MAG TPA: capsular biosynthesis protein [Burkholderiaceae bacterium]|nr:capsular biosynthesis protein [Burkholderiaceae bacterium]